LVIAEIANIDSYDAQIRVDIITLLHKPNSHKHSPPLEVSERHFGTSADCPDSSALACVTGLRHSALYRFGRFAPKCLGSEVSWVRSVLTPTNGVKTLQTQDTSDPRHFGTGAEVSYGHFGTRKTIRHRATLD